jgi:very-short-patch-repair endonuclease
LKAQRETRKDKTDKESVLRTELNNKKRLDKFKFTPITSAKHMKLIH